MNKDRFKYEIAECTALAFKELFPNITDTFLSDIDSIYSRLETPKNPEMGSYALPLFELAKLLKKNPNQINEQLAARQNEYAASEYPHLAFNAAGAFNNARISADELARETITLVYDLEAEYGSSDDGAGKNIVIDFSSPNIAKPFGIGHLRTTALGHSIYRIMKKLGYNPIGINHLGDWGTQFGKLIVAYRNWGDEIKLNDDPIQHLFDLYVRFHKEADNDDELNDLARMAFKRLEEGNQEEAELWDKFRSYSLLSFNKTYSRLGISFDYYWGEAHYNTRMEAVIERLKNAKLTQISEGALIVPLDQYGMPDCLLAKADGATLYATRDITAVLYRWEEFRFDQALYVVGSAQRDHFRQVFKVIELLEEAEDIPLRDRCSDRLKHIEFGWIKFKDENEQVQMMSTRLGNIILLDDVLNRAVALAKSKIEEKNPNLPEIDETAEMIGIGAVLFSDMSSRRHKDINFDWKEVLNFEGESGPYLQYTHARLSSLLRKYGKPVSKDIDYSLFESAEEYRVLDLIYKFPQIVQAAGNQYEPNIIVSYLFELSTAFNKVYQRKDEDGKIVKIVSDDEPLSKAKIAMVASVRIVIKEGLYLLGIEAPEEM